MQIGILFCNRNLWPLGGAPLDPEICMLWLMTMGASGHAVAVKRKMKKFLHHFVVMVGDIS